MARPDFEDPDFLEDTDTDEIQERMMENLPEDISQMEGDFPYDFTMPTAIAQKRNAISRGSLIAVLKRTIDSAPTMPSDRTTLDVTARITSVVIIVSETSVTPKLDEYITPE